MREANRKENRERRRKKGEKILKIKIKKRERKKKSFCVSFFVDVGGGVIRVLGG